MHQSFHELPYSMWGENPGSGGGAPCVDCGRRGQRFQRPAPPVRRRRGTRAPRAGGACRRASVTWV